MPIVCRIWSGALIGWCSIWILLAILHMNNTLKTEDHWDWSTMSWIYQDIFYSVGIMNIRFFVITLFEFCLHQVYSRIPNFTLMEKQKLEQIYILNPMTTKVNIYILSWEHWYRSSDWRGISHKMSPVVGSGSRWLYSLAMKSNSYWFIISNLTNQ